MRAQQPKRMKEIPDQEDFSVVLADLNNFNGLNETYGHDQADEVLIAIADALNIETKPYGGIVGRTSGDEFIILFRGRRIFEDSPEIEGILKAVGKELHIGHELLRMTASLGIMQFDPTQSVEKHIENARVAMNSAKSFDRSTVCLFNDELKRQVEEEQAIEKLTEEAIQNDGLRMVYQPQVDLLTGKVYGYEALVRMKAGDVYPSQFIPVAEKHGLIWKIGRITTELVIKQLAQWMAEGRDVKPVSVNYSSLQMSDDGYLSFLLDTLHRHGVPAGLIKIEITEGILVDRNEAAIKLLKEFKAAGIDLLLDDFGTGYSSLGYLTYIPVDVIKLDKSIVDSFLDDEEDRFVDNIIRLVHDINKRIIIEGVERADQVRWLRKFGADVIQGFYFSMPLPPEEAIRYEP